MKTSTLAENIKRLREEKGLTQDDLARLSGASSIAMIEAGKRKRPQYETIEKIATALGVDVSDLVPPAARRRRPVAAAE